MAFEKPESSAAFLQKLGASKSSSPPPATSPGTVTPLLHGTQYQQPMPSWTPPLAPLPQVQYVNGASVTPPRANTVRDTPSGNAIRFYELDPNPILATTQAEQAVMRGAFLAPEDQVMLLKAFRQVLINNRSQKPAD